MKKIYTFHGECSGCGSAWLARRTAEMIAGKRRDLNVLLVHASHSDSAHAGKSATSMERVRPYMAGRKPLPKGLAEKADCSGKLSVISGAGPSDSTGVFPPDQTESFLKRAAEYYDLIICDSGSELGQGLSLGALFASDRIYSVFSESEESFRRFEWLRPLYKKLGLKINGYVLDRFAQDGDYSENSVAARLRVRADRVFMIGRAAARSELERIADDILKDAFSASGNASVQKTREIFAAKP
ncbi:MAG: hypothetical protein J5535_05185 [Firmicutes bacterium]|nr:hypothetical protein [Bacillota bacterium]